MSLDRWKKLMFYMKAIFCLFLGVFSASIYARDVVVVFPQHIPPWVNSTDERGIAEEIVAQALAYKGHVLKPLYVPFSRMIRSFNTEEVDAVALIEGRKVSEDYYYSDVTTKFTTSLVSLSRNRFSINSMDDLVNKRIIGFLDAKKVFPDIAQLARKNASYEELANQETQVALLFKGRVDLILIDSNIFHFWRNTITKVDTSAAFTFHDLSSISKIAVESPTQTVFKDKALCNDFNLGLRHLKNSGKYNQIIHKHLRISTH